MDPCEPHEVQKTKCKVLHLGEDNAKCGYRLGSKWIESSPTEKDMGALVDEKLNVTLQCMLTAQKANLIRGCAKSSVAIRTREGILLLCSALVRPLLQPCTQLWAQHQEDMELLEQAWRRPRG